MWVLWSGESDVSLTGKGSCQLAPTMDGLIMPMLSLWLSCWMMDSASALVKVYVLGRSPISRGVMSHTMLSSIHLHTHTHLRSAGQERLYVKLDVLMMTLTLKSRSASWARRAEGRWPHRCVCGCSWRMRWRCGWTRAGVASVAPETGAAAWRWHSAVGRVCGKNTCSDVIHHTK